MASELYYADLSTQIFYARKGVLRKRMTDGFVSDKNSDLVQGKRLVERSRYETEQKVENGNGRGRTGGLHR